MAPLEIIAEWRKGCSCAGPRVGSQACAACTLAVMNALERALRTSAVTDAPGVHEEPVRLFVEFDRDHGAADDCSGRWQLAWTNEPTQSGMYQVRFGQGDADPVMELYFDAAPSGGMWKSGEQPPHDYAVLPAVAQWRPIPD